MLLFYSSYGDEEGLEYLLEQSEANGKYNVAFEAAYLLAKPERCIKILIASKRFAEAAMFAKSYCPHMISDVLNEWSAVLKATKLPFTPENIVESPGFKEALSESNQLYQGHIKPNLYDQPRAPADELEM